MFLAPDGAEIEIADTAAKFLSRAIPLDRLHGASASPALSASLRAQFAAMGWFGLVLPEADGGSGLSDELPRVPSGKVSKDVLRARAKAIAEAGEPARGLQSTP